jgi:vacuolar protein-sorting-associated protein 4
MKTELLVQLDGVGNDNSGILLIAASNLPWVLDPALRRRLQKKIHIPLPDEQARRRLFEVAVGDTTCGLSQMDYTELGRRTSGLSGSDISNAVQDALMEPLRKVFTATYWKSVSRHKTVLSITFQ